LMRDFRLVCFGGGKLKASEHERIRQLHIPPERISALCGDDRLLSALYQYAAVFVYPSLYEGFGIPPLEAMQCDCPVICSNTSSLPEVVGQAAYLFDPESTELLREALDNMLYDTAMVETYIDRGREHAAGFSWDQCVAETLTLYRQLAGQ